MHSKAIEDGREKQQRAACVTTVVDESTIQSIGARTQHTLCPAFWFVDQEQRRVKCDDDREEKGTRKPGREIMSSDQP